MTIEIALFRVLQESLTNVHRHSATERASVCFQCKAEAAILEIRDFGRGIPAERLARLLEVRAETGVGLAGMRERLHELKGKLEIESDSRGTSLGQWFLYQPQLPLVGRQSVDRVLYLHPRTEGLPTEEAEKMKEKDIDPQ